METLKVKVVIIKNGKTLKDDPKYIPNQLLRHKQTKEIKRMQKLLRRAETADVFDASQWELIDLCFVAKVHIEDTQYFMSAFDSYVLRNCEGGYNEYKPGKSLKDHNKLLATTSREFEGVPFIPSSFVQKYAITQGQIKEVRIEIKMFKRNIIISNTSIAEVYAVEQERAGVDFEQAYNEKLKELEEKDPDEGIKVLVRADDNTCIVHPIKDNWNYEEMKAESLAFASWLKYRKDSNKSMNLEQLWEEYQKQFEIENIEI